MNKCFFKIKKILLVLFQACILSVLPVISVFHLSCKVTAEGIQMVGGDYVSPELVSYSVNGKNQVTVNFSEQVDFKGFVFSEVIKGVSDSMNHSETEELSPSLYAASGIDNRLEAEIVESTTDKCRYVFEITDEMLIGKSYEMYGMVEDKVGNSLTFAFPFTGYNPRVPSLEIIEVQPDAVSATKNKEKTLGINRNEYVLLKILSDGNLCGVQISSAADGLKKSFTLPAVEVQKGDLVTAHMRSRGNGCICETGEDLNLAFSMYASKTSRDLYSENTSPVLGAKTDIILVRDSGSGCVLDAFMYREESVEEWDNNNFEEYSLLAAESRSYSSGDIENAFVSTGITGTKVFKKNAENQWTVGDSTCSADL